jgi:hypothetical protein
MSKCKPSPLETPCVDQSELKVQPQLEQALAASGVNKYSASKLAHAQALLNANFMFFPY